MMTGLPSLLGRDKSGVDGAGFPISGAGNVSTVVGDSQEDISCLSVMFTPRVQLLVNQPQWNWNFKQTAYLQWRVLIGCEWVLTESSLT
jgi:hypothetical protein